MLVYIAGLFVAAQIRGRNDIIDVAWGLGFFSYLGSVIPVTLPYTLQSTYSLPTVSRHGSVFTSNLLDFICGQ